MSTPRILVVDDEPFNVDYLQQELEELNCETIAATNGKEALEKVHFESPDLILLDIMMPVMDGFEVLTRLKADSATRNIPVIIISANNDLRSVVRGIQLGAEDYLPKPFEPILLNARISSSLEKKRLRDIEQQYIKSMEREFEIAREIQAGFLPSELPEMDGWELATYFKAAREVAGDFYDAFLLPDNNLMIVIGDVCGKGVGAALFMTLFRSLIRATATTDLTHNLLNPTGLSPAERLRHVISFTNDYIVNIHGDSSMFATVFIGSINLQGGTITYINCGNESPLLVRNGNVTATLSPTGPVLGVIPDATYIAKEIRLERNDLLLAFTDGIPDSQNSAGEFFGHERLLKLLNGVDQTPISLLEIIQTSLEQFTSPAHQFDDITILTIKRKE
jgi:sigma-B regulation protein RsbU (phosphoserine phosphatase)